MTLPAVYLALLLPVGEKILPLLTPGAQLLRPLAPAMSSWPGAINMLLGSVANGLVFALLFSGIAVLILRRPTGHR